MDVPIENTPKPKKLPEDAFTEHVKEHLKHVDLYLATGERLKNAARSVIACQQLFLDNSSTWTGPAITYREELHVRYLLARARVLYAAQKNPAMQMILGVQADECLPQAAQCLEDAANALEYMNRDSLDQLRVCVAFQRIVTLAAIPDTGLTRVKVYNQMNKILKHHRKEGPKINPDGSHTHVVYSMGAQNAFRAWALTNIGYLASFVDRLVFKHKGLA